MGTSERTANRLKKDQSPLEPGSSNASSQVEYKMRLFIAGNEPNSVIAQRNINEICAGELEANVELEVIDVFEDFTAAIEENILVTPALIIDSPKKTKIFGNLQDKDKVLSALELL